MQNIPSNSKFAKLIKRCFIAPKGWVFLASDFNALEDVVNTLLTQDPNKVKVLVQGYDGHSFRTYYYWKERYPHINPDNVEQVNSIQYDYKQDRSDSKPISFAMQYQGTWSTLVKNCGFQPYEAKSIEANYQNLYKVSIDWVNARIDEASDKGYATAAFGLRIRTPVLKQVIVGNRATPTQGSAEARTLGNALSGQSYGLLNTYASMKYMKVVRKSEYRLSIRLCAHIHDAIYQYAKDDFGLIAWINEHLMEAMHWQGLPELYHDKIKIGSALDIQHPTWAEPFTIPNGANAEQIVEVCRSEMQKREDAKNGK